MENDISSINDDFKYQKIEWPVKRFSWIAMAVFLLLGAFGLFGDSGTPLTEKSVALPGVVIDYQKFQRVEKSFEMRLHLQDTGTSSVISINQEYIKNVKVTEIIPRPIEEEIKGKQIVYRFRSSGHGTITFFLDPMEMGANPLEITVNGHKTKLSQYIYF